MAYKRDTRRVKMYALEFTVEIGEDRQIHLQLPNSIPAQTAKVIVLYEDAAQTSGGNIGKFDEISG
jgi:hypothetical protein